MNDLLTHEVDTHDPPAIRFMFGLMRFAMWKTLAIVALEAISAC
jgi:hypothetical protein